MTDTTSPLPSVQEPVVDRYRRWNPLWYKFLKPLLETVRSTERQVTEVTSDLTTVTQELDAVQGQYTVKISVNGRVTGAIKLDGSGELSSFAVLADRFIVVHPSANGTTIQAFVVGLVAGVPTVGINGNLIVDDTILARHIDVSTLSSITANIGTVTAGVIQSASGNMVINLNAGTLSITT